jgi:hypothetical protein
MPHADPEARRRWRAAYDKRRRLGVGYARAEARRVRDWYDRERAALIDALGARCALCPEQRRAVLEFDHPNGREYELHRLNRRQRVQRWKAEHAQGLLRLLCRSCNATDGGGRRYGEAGQTADL